MGTFSIWHWLVVLVIVVLVFGTKKLRNLGGDLGSAIKGFKEGMKDANAENTSAQSSNQGSLTFENDAGTTAEAFKEAVKAHEPAAAPGHKNPANETETAHTITEESAQKTGHSSQQTTDSASKEHSQSKV